MMVQGVWSDDPAMQLESTTQFRKLLSIGIEAVCNLLYLNYQRNINIIVDFLLHFCRAQPSN